MILCHKCSCLLNKENETITNAFGVCRCMSSYVRDWQKALTIEEAKESAIDSHNNSIVWLERRNANGDDVEIEKVKVQIEKIKALNI